MRGELETGLPPPLPQHAKVAGVTWTDRLSMLVAAGAIVATLGVGTCSTNARFDDVNRRIDALQADIRELRSLVIDAIKARAAADADADPAAN